MRQLEKNQDLTREWYIVSRSEYEQNLLKEEFFAKQSDFEKKISEKLRLRRKEIMEKRELTQQELMQTLATDIKSCVYDKGKQDKLPVSHETERLSIRVIDSQMQLEHHLNR